LGEWTKELGQRGPWKGRAVRALNPLAAADVALLFFTRDKMRPFLDSSFFLQYPLQADFPS
jgi:hypothetical protein